MCTAVNFTEGRHLFGRTLDLEYTLGQQVLTIPRGFDLGGGVRTEYAIIGVGIIRDGVALLFDGMNERGLCAAALNFPFGSAYHRPMTDRNNLPSFSLLPYILGKCADLAAVSGRLRNINIVSDDFSEDMPATPLHWIIADTGGALTAESVATGLQVYENRQGILTNSPEFPYQLLRLADYMSLGPSYPQNNISDVYLPAYSRGMGAMGLPGDFSSPSRFVRAAFLKKNTSDYRGDENGLPAKDCERAESHLQQSRISRLFHIMGGVSVPLGCALTDRGSKVYTVYTSVAAPEDMTYYFTTYGCRRIRSVRLDPHSACLKQYSMESAEDILSL